MFNYNAYCLLTMNANLFLYSYFIYEISHPNKSGILQVSLVDGPEAQIDLPSSLGPSS